MTPRDLSSPDFQPSEGENQVEGPIEREAARKAARQAKGDAGPRTSKKKPRPRLRAVDLSAEHEEEGAVADWASLFGDLSRRPPATPDDEPPVEWRVHDRTHVEFAIDYPLQAKGSEHTWEAYFFVPESFRLDAGTYDKKAIYDDLWSYVRYAVPPIPFYKLAARGDGTELERVRQALAIAAGKTDSDDESSAAMRRLRLYACLVRASGLSAMRDVERRVTQDPAIAGSFIATCAAVGQALRAVLDEARALELPGDVKIAARWTEEDVSLVLETFCATLGVALEGTRPETAEQLAAFAVKEARHRRARGYDSVGSAHASERQTEHFEFRRHMLKRFTASALWLSLEVQQGARWVLHSLYAVAAAMAMTVALVASLNTSRTAESFLRWGLPVIIAYAVKDRMKAMLQGVFSSFIAKRFPDRKWSIKDRERHRRVGEVHERAGFLPFWRLPPEVLAKRRLTREHALEESARPERVLWHQKSLTMKPCKDGTDGDFSMLTEIFRLNLRRWLSHTDDPNRKIVFADPEDAGVYSATARRVYNINVVYRLTSGDAAAPWHRIRVVVSRKGIERIDSIC